MDIRKSKILVTMELSDEQLHDAVAQYCFNDPRVQEVINDATVTFTIDWSLTRFDADSSACRFAIYKLQDTTSQPSNNDV